MVELLPTLEVCDAPKGESVPVAFMLAGFPDDHSCYAKLAEGMKKTHRVVIACLPLYDQESVKEGQPDFYSWEEILFRLEATVFGCTAEGEKITLIIHDFGCPFGYHFANLHPDKVEKLVGLDIGCTNRLVLAGEGSRHRYRHVKFPAMSPPEPPEKWNKLNQAFYQLYFCMAFLVGQKVNYKAGDVLLHAFFKWAAWVGFIQSKDQPESKHARALQDVHCWMCYPYWACWSRILFQKKSHMFTHTYESQYTNPKVVGHTGLIPLSLPMPPCETLFLYGTRKRVHFHSKTFLKYLKDTPGCAGMGVDGGHWFFLDKPDFVLKIVKDFLNGVVYNWSDPVTTTPKL